jgi:hypothetical protein
MFKRDGKGGFLCPQSFVSPLQLNILHGKHISSQIKSFVFNLLTTIITQQITDILVYNTTII